MTKEKNKRLEIVKNMPELYHTIPGQPFDIRKSEVIQWLIKQPDLLNYLWDHIKQSDKVIYDSEKCTWRGEDYAN